MIKFLKNIGDYFSSNYFDEDFHKKVLEKSGYSTDDAKIFQKRIAGLKESFFKYKRDFLEGKLRVKDQITITHHFHTKVLNALGYEGEKVQYNKLLPLDDHNVLPVRQTLFRGKQPHLMIMEMQALITEGDNDPDGLFEQSYNVEDDENQKPPQKYHRKQWGDLFKVPDGMKISPMVINKAVSAIFLLEQHKRPRYILLCAGNEYFLLEQEKWFHGSYLQFNIEELFSEASIKRDYLSLFYLLLSNDMLAPQSDLVLLEQLDEDSHKSAYEVTKDLKEGVIHAVESIANEAVFYWKKEGRPLDKLNAEQLKDECLTYVYRLLFVFYAESRNDLEILPANDDVYQNGYSLEMLRDLEQVPLNSASSRNGYFFHESITMLFHLLNHGSREFQRNTRSFKVRHLDSPLFDDSKLEFLSRVKIRNEVWQDVICQLSLSRKQKGKSRGRISYANLGINQLGSVYESLLAFRGFFAETDYIEVHRKRKTNESSQKVVNTDGSFLVPRYRIDDFDPAEVYRDKKEELRIIPEGTFIYRLSGRDRQKSASYYTPEVLTQTTVKYTLKPILERLEQGKMKALELLELKILEPAMGAAAFHNEVINQLAFNFLNYRQKELNKKVAPDQYREQLQRVKAYIALNNVYGVDLNPTAIELGKLSLWLNVIHKDMQTPFFGYRLGVGNAVVGAWLKVFKHNDVKEEYPKSGTMRQRNTLIKKEWWNKAPNHLKFGKHGILRRDDEIYHFLLPDKNMVPSSGITLLKDEYTTEAKMVAEWRKEFCKPINADEYKTLQTLSAAIDALLEEHYRFQEGVNAETRVKGDFFGAFDAEEQVKLNTKSYDEKERLAAHRTDTNAPYYKLKMIMDYWCALWFWDVRHADELPSRYEWYTDIANILNLDLDAHQQAEETTNPKEDKAWQAAYTQGSFFDDAKQLNLSSYKKEAPKVQQNIAAAMKQKQTSLFENRRSELVQQLAAANHFFHYQLEFIEVYREHNGFDVAVGNPPWIKLQFEEKGLISEVLPEIMIRKTTAPQVRKMQAAFLENQNRREAYFAEYIETEASAVFMNAHQNYPLLAGQQTNLYKCVLENGFHWISEKGYLGLIHPEGVYDDPKGQPLRKEIYKRLKYHFQFQNAYNLFAEVAHREKYGTNIYSGKHNNVSFYSINNLFQASTIDGCFIDSGVGTCEGIKRKDDASGSFVWNIKPHSSRLVHFTQKELKILAQTFEGSSKWESAKLVGVHAGEIMDVLEKLGGFPKRVKDFETKISVCWDETNDLNAGYIERNTKFPDLNNYEMIYSGPHFFVANPLYKTPKEICTEKADYDTIDLNNIDEDFIARTNYTHTKKVVNDNDAYLPGLKTIKTIEGTMVHDNWFDYYKVGFRKMLSQAGERTLTGAILPPKTAHVNGVISAFFKDEKLVIELMALTSSLVLDFFIKTIGRSNLYDITIRSFPIGIDKKYHTGLFVRTLLLNCVTPAYVPLWERNWQETFKQDDWSKNDSRLKPFNTLTKTWKWETPLRNWYERRQALVEIDVITAMALGITLEELILIYNVQFPVLQQNEDDTWYDTRGNIVFTCSKGLNGVGVDRPVWNTINHLEAGETYEHTIEKSELYHGEKITYHAPFDKCNRVEDYKTAWAHFEKVFNA